MKATIISTGSYVPKKVLNNFDLEKMVETSDEWIVTRTGMKERRIAEENEFTSDMGFIAAKNALEKAKNLTIDDIDLIIVATSTPDYIFPSTGCLIQKKFLTKKNIPSIDVQLACSGFISALSIAKAYVDSNIYKNILIIASEKLSSITNYKDRGTCILFGDGAAACIVGKSDVGLSLEGITLGADGEQAELLMLPGGGSKNPTSLTTLEKNLHYIQMSGNEVFKHAVRRMELSCKECLDLVKLDEKDVNWLIPHQANERIIDAIAKRFKTLPSENIYKEGVQKYGNTSAASIGIALDELLSKKSFKKNENILLTCFGAGLTWGAAILTMKE